MFTRFLGHIGHRDFKLIDIPIELTGRNVRRLRTNLTDEEMEWCCPDNETLHFGRFMEMALPQSFFFNTAVLSCFFLAVGIIAGFFYYPYFTDEKLSTYLTVMGGILFLVACTVFCAYREHKTNTRHMYALATLYSARRFKPYKHYLFPLKHLLYGYFEPKEGDGDESE